jgi:DNA-binding LytR/AlgR family response regulator
MKKFACAVIEDEPLAQNVLKKYIDEHPSLELEFVCSDALEAQQLLPGHNIQLIFLDINLPRLSGINFLKTLSHPPLVIFTTAYPEYAVEGFELDAVDYLVKPFSFERFLKAVNKATDKLNQPEAITANEKAAPFIFLKADKKVYKVDFEDIFYIESIGDYAKVITKQGQYVVNNTLKNLLEELPSIEFMRVHKSFVIAKSKIIFFEGNYVKVSDKEIPIGASYREEIYARLKEKNL